ncbi:hypothetical protein GGR51DRAFT_557528 [Nemania sp. FL0031]|nr:hypothetical protein GGR51DRAFT_557528 [Nemania sp. FL0031]
MHFIPITKIRLKKMKSHAALPPLLLIAATASLAGTIPTASATPTPPPLTHLFTANVTAGTTIVIGPEAGGTRVALPIAAGTFTGARLNGTFLPTGVDAGLLTAENHFYPAGVAVLQTSDGENIIFRDQGFQTGGDIYGAVTFQAGGAGKYAWLNTVVAVSSAVLSSGGSDSGSGIALDVFMLGDAIS